MATLSIVLENNTGAASLFATVTGSDDKGLFLLNADGKSAYRPASPSATLQPLQTDCGIAIGGPGKSKTVTIPHLSGARIWFSKGKPLTFFVNPGPALVEPSATNTADANYKLDWGFCEFTFNTEQLYVNVSYVDFVSLPVSLQLKNASGKTTHVPGMPADGMDRVAAALAAQGGPWAKLVVKNGGTNLRALSPNSGAVLFPGLFDGYYQSYVDAVWKKYSSTDLTVNTQFDWGNVTGRVNGSGKLAFGGGGGSFSKPSAGDIFSCSTGPFAGGEGVSAEQLNVGARLAAALNRSTLLTNAEQPEGEKESQYYKADVTNHYARICHETSVESRGYAFPYDDVGPSKGGDQSGFLNDPNPKVLTVSVGKPFQ